MKLKASTSGDGNEMQFELKYCERCGGLWLRPVGGGQIYCVGCGRQMADLPAASRKAASPRMPQGPQWGVDHCDYDDAEGNEDTDAPGGVA